MKGIDVAGYAYTAGVRTRLLSSLSAAGTRRTGIGSVSPEGEGAISCVELIDGLGDQSADGVGDALY